MDALARRFAVIACIFLFAACSGSGSDPSASVKPPIVETPIVDPPLDPTIEFTDAGPLLMFTGETLDNPVVDPRCVVAYHSNDAAVVTVDTNTGQLVAIAPGTTEIRTTNRMGCDNRTVSVQVKLGEFAFSAWIGTADAEVLFDPTATGYDFFRSRESGCDLSAYAACDHGQFEPLTGVAVTDTAATLETKAYYVLNSPEHTSRETPLWDTLPPSLEGGHAIVRFNERYWMVGGLEGSLDLITSVRSSVDGIHWRVESENPGFAARYGSQVVVFNERLWLLGGSRDTESEGLVPTDEIWSSADGSVWRQETLTNVFPPGHTFQALVHDGRLWAIGNTDVWSSVDGMTWVEETTNTPFSDYYRRAALVWKSRLWVVEGRQVWSSVDGRLWTQEVAEAAFASRGAFELAERQERLWVLPGRDSGDAWSSADGRNWRLESTDFNSDLDSGYVTLVHNDIFILVGGERSRWHAAPLVSADGVEWHPYSPQGAMEPNIHSSAVSFKGRLWLVVGDGPDKDKAGRVWSSSDGLDWQLEVVAPFTRRRQHTLTVFNEQLWLIGGYESGTEHIYLDDIWRSDDGVHWTRVESLGERFAPRGYHSVNAWNGRLWLIGGYSETVFSDIWSSADGIQWRRERGDIGYLLHRHRAVIHGDALYLFVIGVSAEDVPATVVLRSENGVDWVELEQSGFPEGQDHAVVYFESRFWVIAGCTSVLLVPARLGVWSSDDGLSWNREPDFPGPDRCLSAAHTLHNSKWFVIGGLGGFYTSRGFAIDAVWKTNDGRNWRRAFHSSIKMR